MKVHLKSFTLNLVICLSFISCKQENNTKEQLTYFKDSSNQRIISEKEFTKQIKRQELTFKDNENIEFAVKFSDTITKTDSIIYVYTYDIKTNVVGLVKEQEEAVEKIVASKKQVDFKKLTTITNKNAEDIRRKNKPTIIYVWKTKAAACKSDFDFINQLSSNNNYTVFTLSHEPMAVISRFVKENDFNSNHIFGAPYFLSEMKIKRNRQVLIVNKNSKLEAIIDLSKLSTQEAKEQIEKRLKTLL